MLSSPLLNSFLPIRLDEMDEVNLMNRVEVKYVFSSVRLPRVLFDLSDMYKVLEINLVRNFPYYNTYLDTSDYLFYTQQMRGKLNRHKIRYRQYESTGQTFLEIKKKTNKSRTIKWRILNNLKQNSPDEEASAFIKEYLPYAINDLHPVLLNGFTRITMVCNQFRERITLDYNLRFANPDGNALELPYLAIAEVKTEKPHHQSAFINVMKNMGIKPGNFSKYCIGTSLIRDMPRKNLLKQNLLLINKIENEYIKSI